MRRKLTLLDGSPPRRLRRTAPRSSTCTSTPSTRSSTARAGSPTSSRGPPSSRCRRSRSPTTARWRAPCSSSRRRAARASSRSIGCEVYVADDRRAQTKGNAHLTLLAADNAGYANLIKLSSLGYLEGYYYKPRVDWELLERHADGLIALSGCLSGRVCKALEENRPNDAHAELDRLAQVFGKDNVYVELQNAHLDVQARILPQLVAARRGGRPADRRDRRRPLPPRTRTRARTRRCSASSRATRSRTRTTGGSRPTTSTSRRRRRWRATSPATTTRCAARSRSPSAATSRSSSAASCCRSSPSRTAATRSTTSSSSARKACKSATAPSPPSSTSGCSSS